MDNRATLENEIMVFQGFRDRCVARKAIYDSAPVRSSVTLRMQSTLAAQIRFFEDLIKARQDQLSALGERVKAEVPA